MQTTQHRVVSNNVLRAMVDAPWYVPNRRLKTDLQVAAVEEEIKKHHQL